MFEVEKPTPVTVIAVPALPVAAERETLVVTVKVAVVEPPTLSDALTVFAPDVTEGIVKVAVNVPELVLVINEGVVDTGTPLKAIVMVLEEGNPLPVTDTVVPIGPEMGLSAMPLVMV
ncbi:hypothetical protein A3K78_04005 [Candidatus Bathyarchaeota archaeon RBG_13_52_12]|nr:MAG: hypothetical protein A3K78_04005 [Candidatus Bathyarchaeota archaeon RBG_13_52_12]